MVRILGILTGTLSLASLLKNGLEVGFGTTALLVLEYYERLTQIVLGWTEPAIRQICTDFGDLFGVTLILQPHWKHILVLLLLYVGACFRSTWTEYQGNKIIAVYVLVWGICVSLIASVLSGLVPFDNSSMSLLAVIFPIAAISVFEIGLTLIDARYFLNEGYRFAVLGIISILFGTQAKFIPILEEVSNVGLIVFLSFILMLGLYWSLYEIVRAKNSDGIRWKNYTSAPTTRLGIILLSSIFGVFVFILLNAGLAEIGL